MPNKPPKPCAHTGCPELTHNRYCDAHTKAEAQRYEKYDRNPATRKRYGTEWRKIRAAFLSAYPLCEVCSADGKLIPAELVHHKRKLSNGGTHDWNNLQSLCQECHSRLHAKQGDRFQINRPLVESAEQENRPATMPEPVTARNPVDCG